MDEPIMPEATEEVQDISDEEKWAKWYQPQVEHNQQSIDSSADSFDKSMLTLSSGALGVSLAFIKDIVPLEQASGVTLLVISWCLFAFCILITVGSFQFSIAALKRHRSYLDETFKARKWKEPPVTSQALVWCTKGAIFLFSAGCFVQFHYSFEIPDQIFPICHHVFSPPFVIILKRYCLG